MIAATAKVFLYIILMGSQPQNGKVFWTGSEAECRIEASALNGLNVPGQQVVAWCDER